MFLPHCLSAPPPLPVCSFPSPLQEASRFNNLVSVLRRSLAELARALKGLAVMSAELEAMSTALLNNQVRMVGAKGGKGVAAGAGGCKGAALQGRMVRHAKNRARSEHAVPLLTLPQPDL